MNSKRVCQFTALAIVCITAVSFAEEPLWNDGGGGATRDYYHKAAGLKWDRKMGDWLDADGEPWGAKPFDTVLIKPQSEGQTISFDVTALVGKWISGNVNQGFYLKSEQGIVKFTSREHRQKKPALIVDFHDHLTKKYPVYDTYLDSSTARSLGDAGIFKVAGNSNALVWFDLSDLTLRKSLESARLVLHVNNVYGGGATVNLFEAFPAPKSSRESNVKYGLAQNYVMDQGLKEHPAIYYAEDFDSKSWETGTSRRWLSEGKSGVVTDAIPTKGDNFIHGKVLRAEIPQGGKMGLNQNYKFTERGQEEPDEAYFRYYIRLSDDWNQTVSGGKLPGFAGTYGRAGWGGRKANGTNGWSARGSFKKSFNTYSGERVTPIGNYVYHAGQKGYYGNIWMWNESGGAALRNSRWYCIEQYVKLNDPGKNNGVLRVWLDGKRVFNREDLRYRDTEQLKIEAVWFNIYHGGTAASPRTQHLDIDNIVIAEEYIGPVNIGR